MTLDIEAPDPPELDPAGDGGDPEDYRREVLADFLRDGAWERAFDDWRDRTDLDAAAFGVVDDLDMIERFDFFWDEFAGRVGFHAPGLPEDWRERDLHPDLNSWETASTINADMADLGRTVADLLTEEYVDWEGDDAVGEDLPDFE